MKKDADKIHVIEEEEWEERRKRRRGRGGREGGEEEEEEEEEAKGEKLKRHLVFCLHNFKRCFEVKMIQLIQFKIGNSSDSLWLHGSPGCLGY